MQLKHYGEIKSTIALLPIESALVLQEVLGMCVTGTSHMTGGEVYDQLDLPCNCHRSMRAKIVRKLIYRQFKNLQI